MKSKKYIIIFLLLMLPIIYVVIGQDQSNPDILNNLSFKRRLSAYGLFLGEPSALKPAKGVEPYFLSATLFTDYAQKQRLIKLPIGKKMTLNGDGLPVFPEETMLIKTFYYSGVNDKSRRIVETRLLVLHRGVWNVATYKWDAQQKDAYLLTDGDDVPLTINGLDGKLMPIKYHIPRNKDCVSCHHSGNKVLPIGPKGRNLNRTVMEGSLKIDQLQYFMEKGLLENMGLKPLSALVDDKDQAAILEQRARAYLDINCAHCHSNGGYAGQTSLNLDYGVDIAHSGIMLNKNNIIIRMHDIGSFHMPKLGTTVVDERGLELIKEYIKNIK